MYYKTIIIFICVYVYIEINEHTQALSYMCFNQELKNLKI